jgi:hypothetical protein
MSTGRLCALGVMNAAGLLVGCADREIARAKDVAPRAEAGERVAVGPASPGPQDTVASAPTTPAPPTQPPSPPTTPTPAPASPQDTPPTTTSGLKEVFPGVRVNAEAKLVEFDAIVPLNAQDPQKPRQYLEVIACTPDTKEHEAVLMTRAQPSHLHAALLLIGLEPGTPGVWNWEGEKLETIPPKGPRVKVTAVYQSRGKSTEVSPAQWVIDARTNKTLAESEPESAWLFAGSQIFKRQGEDAYRADSDGTLIGLHTFGGELLAWSKMYNPDSGVEEPRWIANAATVPAYNTAVVVRLERAQ